VRFFRWLTRICRRSACGPVFNGSLHERGSGVPCGLRAIKCGYKVDQTFFFWFQKVPSHLVALVKNDPKASLRALGSSAVQECPTTPEAAEGLYREKTAADATSWKGPPQARRLPVRLKITTRW
jgi:hypothetical protein